MGVMRNYPIEIRRCRHVKTNGTQCGSPALKGKELCFFHERNQPRAVELYLDGERYSDGSMVLPAFEDAHAIQTVIRQVVELMLARRIDRKDAGLLLYALQIASGNLKTMRAEKATPTQVVVEPDKAEQTPLGMTPWSASGQGHDAEAGESEGDTSAPPPSADEFYAAMSVEERIEMRKELEGKGLIRRSEFDDFLWGDGRDPLLLAMRRLWAEREARERREAASSESEEDMAPGTIQACGERPKSGSVLNSTSSCDPLGPVHKPEPHHGDTEARRNSLRMKILQLMASDLARYASRGRTNASVPT